MLKLYTHLIGNCLTSFL